MFDRHSETLPFILLLCISLSVLSVPVSQPKTLYEAVQLKCPSVKNTDLETNLHDVFNSTCANWSAIVTDSSLKIENGQCLLLYESLVSFCTALGDKLPKFKGLFPTKENVSLYDGNTVCFTKNPFGNLSKAEHNISKFTSPIICALSCLSDDKSTTISDVCQFSYYFASFNGSMFLEQYDNMLAKKNSLEKGNKTAQAPAANSNANTQGAVPSKVKAEEAVPQIKPSENVEPAVADVKPPENAEPAQEAAPPVAIAGSNQAQLLPTEKKIVTPVSITIKGVTSGVKAEDIFVPVAEKKPEENVSVEQEANKNGPVDTGAHDESLNKIQDEEGFEEEEEAIEEKEDNAGRADVMPVMPQEIDQSTSSKKAKPNTVDHEAASNYNIPEEEMDGDSYFLSYFTVIMCLVIVGYIGYHNRQKILALVLEGKRSKRPGRQGRRPNSANYHKLDSNLEEAMSSSCTRNASNVIY